MSRPATTPTKSPIDANTSEDYDTPFTHISEQRSSDKNRISEGSDLHCGSLRHEDQSILDHRDENWAIVPVPDLERRPVRWSMLEQSVQSYIFGHLMYELKDITLVAGMLGLRKFELSNVLHILAMQKRHPLSVDQLYSCCVTLGDASRAFVDPDVLKQYLPYFQFASNFDGTTSQQRILAYLYLKHCNIKGGFVDALLLPQDNVWIGHSRTLVPIHKSHNREAFRELIYSRYVPFSVRSTLFAKEREKLTSHETWILYYESQVLLSQNTTDSSVVKPTVLDVENLPQYAVKVTRKLREHFLESNVKCSHGSRDAIDTLLLHLIVAAIAQTQLLRSRLKDLPVANTERYAIFNIAQRRLEQRLLGNLRTAIAQQLRIDNPDHVSGSWDDILSAVNDSTCCSVGAVESREFNAEADIPHEPPPILKLVVKDNKRQSATIRSRSQPQSTASFHTAQDDTENDGTHPIAPLASPERPDFSPLNSDEEESDTETAQSNTKTSNILYNFPVKLQRRYTPWKSNRRFTATTDITDNISKSLIPASLLRNASNSHRISSIHNGQHLSAPSDTLPQLLTGIEKAASRLESLPAPSPVQYSKPESRKPHQPRAPLILKVKPRVQTEKGETALGTSSHTALPQSENISSIPKTVATLNNMASFVGAKRTRAPRKDKGQKRSVYKKRKLDSVGSATRNEAQQSDDS